MSTEICFHCALRELIAEIYPDGMSGDEANHVLCSIGSVVGEFLTHAVDANATFDAFSGIVNHSLAAPPAETPINFRIKREMH